MVRRRLFNPDTEIANFKMLALFAALTTLATTVVGQLITGQYTCMAAGEFTLCQNLWGESMHILPFLYF